MKNKVCLITGANSGIGFEAALELAKREAYVVLLCRNEQKGLKAKEEIKRKTGNTGVELIIADLAWQKDIRRAASEFLSRFDKLDVLINNAGIIPPSKRETTADDIEIGLAVNHLAPFLLTHLLMDPLKKADNARVITVASEAHRSGRFNKDNLELERGYNTIRSYGNSKMYNIMFARELAKRTDGSNITSFSLHPGVVSTNLDSGGGFSWFGFLFKLGKPFMISPKKGSQTTIYLATEPGVEKWNGGYFKSSKPATPWKAARNDEDARVLWEMSGDLVGL
jgi:NAD(P)-dependent dehydrogenase (short-subunit alcohol dehydrogenase family)